MLQSKARNFVEVNRSPIYAVFHLYALSNVFELYSSNYQPSGLSASRLPLRLLENTFYGVFGERDASVNIDRNILRIIGYLAPVRSQESVRCAFTGRIVMQTLSIMPSCWNGYHTAKATIQARASHGQQHTRLALRSSIVEVRRLSQLRKSVNMSH